jgi:site-specific recombinase XerD
MQRLTDDARLASKLSFLSPHSRDQLLRYLCALSARQYAPGTIEAVITVARRFLRDLPPPRRDALADDFTRTVPRDITDFVCVAQGAGLAPSTINLSLSVLSEFFDFLRDEGLMPSQPVIPRRHRLLAPATLPKPMPEPELVRFFKAVDSQRDRILFLLMLRCGLRVSEACALRWNDCDLAAGTIRVNDGKGRVDRVVYTSPDLERELKAWRARSAGATYLFPSRRRKGLSINRWVVNLSMREYLRSARIDKRYTPHCLRHTFATQLLNAGVTLEVLKELMGHRSIQNTLKYAQLYEETKRRQYDEAMARVERRQAAAGGRR